MAQDDILIHFHSWAVSMDTFKKYPRLVDFMKVIQTDVYKNAENGQLDTKFIIAMESYDYPIWSTLYHPENKLNNYVLVTKDG